MHRLYRYVGPPEIAAALRGAPPGAPIRSATDLRAAVRALGGGSSIVVTFVVDGSGTLRVADRSSEHVACAAGGPVLSAGELECTEDGEVVEASNQSTGFCPEPGCWAALDEALRDAGIEHPGGFTAAFDFRRCACGARALVKDEVYECLECGADLPRAWTFERARIRRALAPSWQLDMAEESASERGEDRLGVVVDEDGALVVVADGAGGRSGGAAAAERLVDTARRARPLDATAMIEVITRVDAALAAEAGGETTAVLARLRGDGSAVVVGVGDSGALILDGSEWADTRDVQPRKPLVGSGSATPVVVTRSRCDTLLVATDGLLAYAKWDAITRLAASADPEAIWKLVDAARLPSGGLSDDVAVVLARAN
ncbi:MAG: SpoIIE family protein phosphatase [Sandaracinaceae bacterium]